MLLKLAAAFRYLIGSPKIHNSLNINRDGDGNYSISIQESGGDFGNQRSGGVRVEAASGDPQQQLVFQAVANLVKAIKESHEKYPTHPAFIVTDLDN